MESKKSVYSFEEENVPEKAVDEFLDELYLDIRENQGLEETEVNRRLRNYVRENFDPYCGILEISRSGQIRERFLDEWSVVNEDLEYRTI